MSLASPTKRKPQIKNLETSLNVPISFWGWHACGGVIFSFYFHVTETYMKKGAFSYMWNYFLGQFFHIVDGSQTSEGANHLIVLNLQALNSLNGLLNVPRFTWIEHVHDGLLSSPCTSIFPHGKEIRRGPSPVRNLGASTAPLFLTPRLASPLLPHPSYGIIPARPL